MNMHIGNMHIGFRSGASALAVVMALAAPAAQASFVVAPGYDLLATWPGTFFNTPPSLGGVAIPFTGAPDLIRNNQCDPGEWDFGNGEGCQDIGSTSAIIQRLDAADSGGAPGTAPRIDIEFVALGLRSENRLTIPSLNVFDEFLEIVLAGDDGSWADITFKNHDGGTFDTELNFRIDVSTSGGTQLLQNYGCGNPSGFCTLEQELSFWGRERPPQPVGVEPIPQIVGVNYLLNGQNTEEDFWSSTGPYADHLPPVSGGCSGSSDPNDWPTVHDGDHRHCTRSAPPPIPVPAGLPLLATGAAVFGLVAARRRRASA